MPRHNEAFQVADQEIPSQYQEQFEDVKTVDFKHGSVQYSVIGEFNPDTNPIIINGGMDNGRVNLLAQAAQLAKKGETQVLIVEQPSYDHDVPYKFKTSPDNALDFLANAAIAAAEDAGFLSEGRVANMTGHSLGGQVANRIREIAEKENITALLPENGSLLALLGSAGASVRESKVSMAARWPFYMIKGLIEAKVLDPAGKNGATVMKNAMADPAKTFGEVRALSERKNNPNLDGAIAVIYPEDHMFPENRRASKFRSRKRVAKVLGRGLLMEACEKGYKVPFVTPIDPGATSIKGLDRWMTLAHLKGRRARLEYALSHRGAGHDEPANNPKRTANIVVDFFGNPDKYLNILK